MSISHHQTASGRPLRVAPAWVGGARPASGPADEDHLLPVREAVWVWGVRRYARLALWALPAAAVLYGWSTLGIDTPPGPLLVELAAHWLAAVAMIALAGLLAGARTRRYALAGLLLGLAGSMLTLPLLAVPPGVAAAGSPLTADQLRVVEVLAAATAGAGWLLLGWAVFRCRLVAGERLGEEFTDLGIGVHRRPRVQVVVAPLAQEQAFGPQFSHPAPP